MPTTNLLIWVFSIVVLFFTGCSGRKTELPVPSKSSESFNSTLSQELFNFVPVSRMRALPGPVLEVNTEVARELRHYRAVDTRFVPLAMARYERHGPTVERILADEGIPPSLAAVALVESAFHPEARSRSGAVGMWQFMKGTALVYGLRVNWFEDQRKDVILSSLAAARHLRDLYTAYNDWALALAAYNAGSAAVDRAVVKGRTRDFWELSRRGFFRTETSRYVPKVLAGAMLMEESRSAKRIG